MDLDALLQGHRDAVNGDGGAGFGLIGRPVGAYVMKGEGVRWVPAVDVNRLLGLALLVGLAFALRR